ncbi:MAG: ATP-binding cassette domain-containing protein [Dehalococcoidales bacterium]
MNSIVVEGLTKIYPRVKAVDNVSFTIDQGEIFGFLGPNGAGKTTTIKILLTLLRPTAGKISIFGIDALAHSEKIRQIAGYVPQDVSVDGDLTGYENMLIYAKLYRVPRGQREQRIRETLEYLGINDRAGEMVNTYSGGMMRRLEIAQSLINRPRVLFLDEPSIGLDPSARIHMWELIKQLRDEFGATILLNTHDMAEADTLCDRIGIMDRGKLIIIGTPSDLKSRVGGDVLTISSQSPGCMEKLQHLGYQVMAQPTNHHLDLLVSSGESLIPPLLESLKIAGIEVESVSLKKPTLDDVFLKYTGTRMDERDTWQAARKSRRTLRKLNG